MIHLAHGTRIRAVIFSANVFVNKILYSPRIEGVFFLSFYSRCAIHMIFVYYVYM